MRVTMIGAGYVGLVSGACFADFGHHVTCIDKDAPKVAALNRGEIPIFEPGLADLVEANVHQERLRFAVDTASVATFHGERADEAGPGDRLVACGKSVSNIRLSANPSPMARTVSVSYQNEPYTCLRMYSLGISRSW